MFRQKGTSQKDHRLHRFILIVTDDETLAATLTQALLHEKSYITLAVSGSKDALALDGVLKPDLLVLDDSLSAREGNDLHDVLSTARTLKNVPTIILGTQPAPQGGAREVKQTVRLLKTIGRDELLIAIKQLLDATSTDQAPV